VLDLPRFERDAETFCRALNRARYLFDAGLEAALDLSTLYDDFTYLFRDDTYGELLEAQAEPKPKRYLLDFVATGYAEDHVRAYSERLAARQVASTVVWDEQALPYRAVPIWLANEPDAHRRHELDARWRAVTTTLNPLHEERHRALLETSQGLGRGDYVTLTDELRDWHLVDLSEAARRFLEVTERPYLEALEELLGTIGLAPADAAPCDLAWLFRMPQLDTWFTRKGMLPALHRSLWNLGADFAEAAGIVFDAEPRPLKTPRAFCAPLAIPEDVRLVMAPVGGRLDYTALFRLTGRAERYVHTDRTLVFPYKWLGDSSVTASHGLLFEHLLVDPAWLERYLELDNPTDYLRLAQFDYLYRARRDAAGLLYAQELHRGDDYERLAQRYAELFTITLGVEHSPEVYLADGREGFAAVERFRAAIFEAQYRRYLQREYEEEWYRVPRVGRFLRDLWREGQKYSVDELARYMGYEGLDLRPLTEELLAGVR
jgi:hypothetical protein